SSRPSQVSPANPTVVTARRIRPTGVLTVVTTTSSVRVMVSMVPYGTDSVMLYGTDDIALCAGCARPPRLVRRRGGVPQYDMCRRAGHSRPACGKAATWRPAD